MIFSVERQCEERFSFDLTKLGKRVMKAVLLQEGFPYLDENGDPAAEVDLLLTDDEGIRAYNAQYRYKDAVTDVLSFPSAEFTSPCTYEVLEEEGAYDASADCYQLGDIVLNLHRVREQAKRYGHSEKREAAFLIAHSILHLIGYDHESKAEAQRMEEKQEAVLQKLKITRDGIR